MALFKAEDLKDELLPVEMLESGKVIEKHPPIPLEGGRLTAEPYRKLLTEV